MLCACGVQHREMKTAPSITAGAVYVVTKLLSSVLRIEMPVQRTGPTSVLG